VEPTTSRLDRLDLVLLSPACLAALVAGRRDEAQQLLGAAIPGWWPDEPAVRLVRRRLEQVTEDESAGEWLLRGLVLREVGELVGHAGFHGPPGVSGPGKDGAVELGYTVFPQFRGRGLATEAAVGLIRWARDERGIDAFIASVSPGNDASLAIVRKLGFEQVGEQWDDEDGLELVFETSAAAL
jgi:ribosomal-protein-alanine N-acetyltransferase